MSRNSTGLIGKLGALFGADEEEEYYDDDIYEESPRREYARRDDYGLREDYTPVRREAMRQPLYEAPQPRRRERDNVISMEGKAVVEKLTSKFKIVVVEPRSFDECPTLVDSLKGRKPVIINLEMIENDSARKIFDFLSGATYALNGNVQKIAQNIFVFLPENVDVTTAEPAGFRYNDEDKAAWR